MTTKVVVRLGTAEDLDAIVELFALLNAFEQEWRVFPLPLDDSHRTRSRFARLISADDAAVIVAEADERLVGLGVAEIAKLSSYSDEAGVEFSNVFVQPAFRRRGVGIAIVRELAAFAERRGVRRIALKVFSPNVEAARFWRGLGFAPRLTQFTGAVDELLAWIGDR
jgi:ribosomal protein S18 acetylase RimI-like enzyme